MRKRALIASLTAVGLVLTVILSLSIGARDIPFSTVVDAFFNVDPDNPEHTIIRTLRLDRTIIGLVAGGALAVAGALIQSLTRNPLADPGLLGLNAGAALGVVSGVVFLGTTTMWPQFFLAFAGAAVVGVSVYLIGGTGRAAPTRLLLTGAAVTALITAANQGIILTNPSALDQFRFWVSGSLTGRLGLPLAPFVIIFAVGLLLAILAIRPLQAIALGEDAAAGLGTSLPRTRVHVLATVILLSAMATALAGPIAFVGLAVPHLVRTISGPRLSWLIALSAPIGGLVVLLCDVVGRVITRPGEMSVGITTALIGGVFLALLARRKGVVSW